MSRYATPGQLTVGSEFVDPRREGRRLARVVQVLCTKDGQVFFELDDDTKWGPWTASYNESEQLELL